MTAAELEEIISKVDLQSLSDEDLARLHALFSTKEAEADWIIRGRKEYSKAHSPSKKKE